MKHTIKLSFHCSGSALDEYAKTKGKRFATDFPFVSFDEGTDEYERYACVEFKSDAPEMSIDEFFEMFCFVGNHPKNRHPDRGFFHELYVRTDKGALAMNHISSWQPEWESQIKENSGTFNYEGSLFAHDLQMKINNAKKALMEGDDCGW